MKSAPGPGAAACRAVTRSLSSARHASSLGLLRARHRTGHRCSALPGGDLPPPAAAAAAAAALAAAAVPSTSGRRCHPELPSHQGDGSGGGGGGGRGAWSLRRWGGSGDGDRGGRPAGQQHNGRTLTLLLAAAAAAAGASLAQLALGVDAASAASSASSSSPSSRGGSKKRGASSSAPPPGIGPDAFGKATAVLAKELAFGAIWGFCVVLASRGVNPWLALFVTGLLATAHTVLNHDVITANANQLWRALSAAAHRGGPQTVLSRLRSVLDSNGDGRVDAEDVSAMASAGAALLFRGVPLIAGFSTGLLLGNKYI